MNANIIKVILESFSTKTPVKIVDAPMTKKAAIRLTIRQRAKGF